MSSSSKASCVDVLLFFFFSSRRRHTRFDCDCSSDVCSSDLVALIQDNAIAVANPAFSKLLGVADTVEGRGPLEVSRLPSMAEVVDLALAGKDRKSVV